MYWHLKGCNMIFYHILLWSVIEQQIIFSDGLFFQIVIKIKLQKHGDPSSVVSPGFAFFQRGRLLQLFSWTRFLLSKGSFCWNIDDGSEVLLRPNMKSGIGWSGQNGQKSSSKLKKCHTMFYCMHWVNRFGPWVTGELDSVALVDPRSFWWTDHKRTSKGSMVMWVI